MRMPLHSYESIRKQSTLVPELKFSHACDCSDVLYSEEPLYMVCLQTFTLMHCSTCFAS